MSVLHGNTLNEAIAALFGEDVCIAGRRPVYGGDINDSYRLELSDGSAVFMKCNSLSRISLFEAEAEGLEALRAAGAIGVPKALAVGMDGASGRSFLLMEYLDAARRNHDYWEVFGRELAALHRAECGPQFGFASDNFIGASPQINTPRSSWIDFFRECRLLPQMRMAEDYFDAKMRAKCGKLLDRLDSFLTEPERPSLLHGDLWSGNAVCGPDGKAWILDPAVYIGHFEADLAMTELFGGFSSAFYGAYREQNPIDGGYRDRRDLYNLYHMLNHLNLFGGSYYRSVQAIVERYV